MDSRSDRARGLRGLQRAPRRLALKSGTAEPLTHTTAVAIVPPRRLWPPIQAIRTRYDRHVRRWMPHVTLLYPFVPRERLEVACDELGAACADVEPFRITLGDVRTFEHRGGGTTLWLAPEPAEAIGALHARLLETFPGARHTASFARGFTPHLSVGQARGADQRERRLAEITSRWRPERFACASIAVLARGERAPDDRFEIHAKVPLGS